MVGGVSKFQSCYLKKYIDNGELRYERNMRTDAAKAMQVFKRDTDVACEYLMRLVIR